MARLTINGEAVELRVDPAMPLLWALREEANLTGTKYGCNEQTCGACTVVVDGRAVKSCAVTLAQLEGSAVTTIEGLGGHHPAQQAWLAEQVTMCGFCEPGFIMAIAARLQAHERNAPIDNVCACGAYPRIAKAVARALGQRVAEPATTAQFSLGSSDDAHSLPER